MTKQRQLFDNPAATDWRETLRCPACGYRPGDEVRDTYPQTDAPETREEALDFFEVSGADEGNVFCPKCACEFDTDTGEPYEGVMDEDGCE